jgi:hypothetical protein
LLLEKKNSWSTGPENSSSINCITLFILIFSILVTRIATVAMTYTDLSRESAKFQARSVFIDDVGFTTNESEKAVTPPV